MRLFERIFLLLILVFAIGVFANPLKVVMAKGQLVASSDECKLETKPGESIPSSFPVGKCLKTETQKTYTPASDAENNPGQKGLTAIFVKVVNLLTGIIGSISLIVFIIGALLTIVSEGKEDRLEKGKNAMFYAIIGLIVALMSFIIVSFVQSILY